MKKQFLAAAAAALLCAAPARAQTDTTATPQKFLLTVNPIGILLDYYSLELEHALSDVVSVSAAGEHSGVSDTEITAVDFRLRYYPQAKMFSGLALGASLGYGTFNGEEEYSYEGGQEFITDNDLTGPTVGLEVNYNYLVGRDRRLFVGLGFGLRRLLSGGNDSDDTPDIVPGGRYFAIGYTF